MHAASFPRVGRTASERDLAPLSAVAGCLGGCGVIVVAL